MAKKTTDSKSPKPTRSMIAMLGKKADKEVADQFRVALEMVCIERQRRGIKPNR